MRNFIQQGVLLSGLSPFILMATGCEQVAFQPHEKVIESTSSPSAKQEGLPSVSKAFQDTLKNGQPCSFCPQMVTIPAGSFRMGDIRGIGESDEQPVHTVTVKSFAMSRHEVTFEEYDYFAEQTGREKSYDSGWGRDNRPVIYVFWDDAVAYAEWLSQVTGNHYRLPTEAEWEYAARAGTETDYWWGNTASHEYANYGKDECCGGLVQGKDQWEFTAPVCSFVYNPFGLCDTVGNVLEWTCSEYEGKYNGKELECLGKNRANHGSLLVLRGGAWDDLPRWVRASDRNRNARAYRPDRVGFRLARE